MRDDICTAIDIGSSKISCVIFKINSNSKKPEILGVATKYSEGIRGGVIENITEATASISSAVYEAEKQASIVVKKVIAAISHPFINSKIVITDSKFAGRQILSKDLKDISKKILCSANQAKQTILHSSLISYDVDRLRDIIDPEYMFANNLRSYYNIITAPKSYLDLVKQCLRDLHLIPNFFIASSYASSLALDPKNMEEYVLIDVGGGALNIASLRNSNSILWASSVPLGGKNITGDISECFAIPYEEAEKLKILYGKLTTNGSDNSVFTNETVSKTGINLPVLNKIISARIEEMIEIAWARIPEEYRKKNIILSGGVAKTSGIADFIAKKVNTQTDVIVHSSPSSCFDEKQRFDPAFSTIIGLINYHVKETTKKKPFSVKKALEWMWENF